MIANRYEKQENEETERNEEDLPQKNTHDGYKLKICMCVLLTITVILLVITITILVYLMNLLGISSKDGSVCLKNNFVFYGEVKVKSINGKSLKFEYGSVDLLTSNGRVNVNTIVGRSSRFDDINENKDIKFEDYTNAVIDLEGRTIKHVYDDNMSHVYYLNKEILNDGVYRFSFKYNGKNKMILGIVRSKSKNEEKIEYDDNQVCSIDLFGGFSSLNGFCGTKKIKESLENMKAEDNSIYELIINMNEKTMSIRQNKGNEILLYSNIPTNVIPYVELYYAGDIVSLIKTEF